MKRIVMLFGAVLATQLVLAVPQWTNAAGDWDIANAGNWSETVTSSSSVYFYNNFGDLKLSKDMEVGSIQFALWVGALKYCSLDLGGHTLKLAGVNTSKNSGVGLGTGAKYNALTFSNGTIDFGEDNTNMLYTIAQNIGNDVDNSITITGENTLFTNVYAILMRSGDANLTLKDKAVLHSKHGFRSQTIESWLAYEARQLTASVLSGAKLYVDYNLELPPCMKKLTISGEGSQVIQAPMYVTHPSKIGPSSSDTTLEILDGGSLVSPIANRVSPFAVGFGAWGNSTNNVLHLSNGTLQVQKLCVGWAYDNTSSAYTNQNNVALIENDSTVELLSGDSIMVSACADNGAVGGGTNSFDNALIVKDSKITNNKETISGQNRNRVVVGYRGARNRFEMTNSTYEALTGVEFTIGVEDIANSNAVVFSNSTFGKCRKLVVGGKGSWNTFRLENGSSMEVELGSVGEGGCNNTMIVDNSTFTSTGDRFDPSGNGATASNNTFVACNGAKVTLRRLRLGYGGSQHNNLIVSNATISVQSDAGAYFCGFGSALVSTNNLVRLQGETPLIVADDTMHFGCKYKLAFDMAETGFKAAPIQSTKDWIIFNGAGELVFEGNGITKLARNGGARAMPLIETVEGKEIRFVDVNETELLESWNAALKAKWPRCSLKLSSDRRQLLLRVPSENGTIIIVR